MSHELIKTDHMVSGRNVTPWHGLGTVVAGLLDAPAALAAAKLNWQVQQSPVFDGDMKQIAGYVQNRRSDNQDSLGIVSDTWEPVQNERLLEIAEALAQVDAGDFRPVIETAGSLRGGRIVWALVQTSQRSFVDSQHKGYLLLSNGHDGTRAMRATLTDVRVVCNNTLSAAERAQASIMISHSKGVEARFKKAVETIGWANDATRATFAIYGALAAAPVTVDKARDYFRGLMLDGDEVLSSGKAEAVDVMVNLFRSGPGNSGQTYFDALNAVTDYADHHRPMRDDDNTAERRFIGSALGGVGVSLKSAALRKANLLVRS